MTPEVNTKSVLMQPVENDNPVSKPKKGKLDKAPTFAPFSAPTKSQKNWALFKQAFKTFGLMVKNRVGVTKASELRCKTLDRKDAAYATEKRFAFTGMHGRESLKNFADPKLVSSEHGTKLISAQLGKLMEAHMGEDGRFNLVSFKEELSELAKLKLTAKSLNDVNFQALEAMSAQFRREGRTDKADALNEIIAQYRAPKTIQGARDFYWSSAMEKIVGKDPGSFLRQNDDSAPFVGLLLPQGLSFVESQLKNRMQLVGNSPNMGELNGMFGKPREQIDDKEKGIVSTRPLTQITSDAFTKDEAQKLVAQTMSVLKIMGAMEPTDQLVNGLKELADKIKEQIGEGDGKISQSDANKMIRALYVNAIILRMANPLIMSSGGEGVNQTAKTVLSALVQNVANGVAREGHFNVKLGSEELRKELTDKGVTLSDELDKMLVEKFRMPKECTLAVLSPVDPKGKGEEDLEEIKLN